MPRVFLGFAPPPYGQNDVLQSYDLPVTGGEVRKTLEVFAARELSAITAFASRQARTAGGGNDRSQSTALAGVTNAI